MAREGLFARTAADFGAARGGECATVSVAAPIVFAASRAALHLAVAD